MCVVFFVTLQNEGPKWRPALTKKAGKLGKRQRALLRQQAAESSKGTGGSHRKSGRRKAQLSGSKRGAVQQPEGSGNALNRKQRRLLLKASKQPQSGP